MKSVCIAGVDGTGKTTIVNLLYDKIGHERSVVQYMGMKEWETEILKRLHSEETKPTTKLGFVFERLLVIHELYHRVLKHRKSGKIIIFDRYSYEQCLIFKRDWDKHRLRTIFYYPIFKLFLGLLFPKPTVEVYLHCNEKVSLKRKDDIVTDEQIGSLRRSKIVMDRFYLNKNKVVSIDTSFRSIPETLNLILFHLREAKLI